MFLSERSSGSCGSSSESPGLSYASTSRTSLLMGLSSLESLLVNIFTDSTWPWSSGWVATTLAMGHLFLGDWFSFNSTTSPTWKFLRGRIHLFLACNCCKYSLLNLDQNSCARCCVPLHLFLQCKPSLLNYSSKGSTSLVFPVSSIPGDNGAAEMGSLRVSTVRGLLLIVYSASQRKVRSNSSSRRLPCSLMSPFMTFLIDLICLSQTPTKLLADAGFLIQSMLSLRSYAFIFWSSISSIAFLSSASAPMKYSIPLFTTNLGTKQKKRFRCVTHTNCTSAKQKIVHGHGPSNINLGIFVFAFDVCRA